MKILKHHTLRRAVRATLLICSLPMLLLIDTARLAAADTTTTVPSNAYGEGGTVETTSGEDHVVKRTVYRDKCGRIRHAYSAEYYNLERNFERYFSPNGDAHIDVSGGNQANPSYSYHSNPPIQGQSHHLDPDNAKEILEGWKKAPIPPCPEKTNVAPAPPEKPKDHPNPLEKLLQGVSIGVGVSGGRTVGRDDHKGDHHVTDRKHTSSTTKKLPAGCKCHPCTCSPCHCGG
jgi:hypothetical protein